MCSTRSRGEQFLARWAIPQLHDIDALSRMVDPSLKGKYPVKALSRFADIISRCVQVFFCSKKIANFIESWLVVTWESLKYDNEDLKFFEFRG